MGAKDLDSIMIDTKANIIKTDDGFSETNMLLNLRDPVSNFQVSLIFQILGSVVKFLASSSYSLKSYKKKLQIFDINTLITPLCPKSPTWTLCKNLQEKTFRKTCVLDSHQAQEKNSGQISLVYVV